jgi:FMN-dependent NADH-azoreductase
LKPADWFPLDPRRPKQTIIADASIIVATMLGSGYSNECWLVCGHRETKEEITMAKILHINASPRAESRSLAVAQAFLESYRKAHPDDTVETLNLFESKLIPFDGAVMQAKYAVLGGNNPTDEQKAAWAEVEKLADHFKGFDKYIVNVPMWNFNVPYTLKHYIDILTQPGLTFTHSPEKGYQGLVTGRKAFVAYARGGEYAEGTDAAAIDHQKPWFNFALNFIGITDLTTVDVEGTLYGPEVADKRTAEAAAKARELANGF